MRVSSLLGRNASRCDFKQLFPRLAGVALHGETGATQTGMARDITFRVLDVLASTDLVAAEDTRSLHRLVEILDVPSEGHSNPRLSRSLHAGAHGKILDAFAAGLPVAYTSKLDFLQKIAHVQVQKIPFAAISSRAYSGGKMNPPKSAISYQRSR